MARSVNKSPCVLVFGFYGVFTLAWSGTGTGTGAGKNVLYGFNKNFSHCT